MEWAEKMMGTACAAYATTPLDVHVQSMCARRRYRCRSVQKCPEGLQRWLHVVNVKKSELGDLITHFLGGQDAQLAQRWR